MKTIRQPSPAQILEAREYAQLTQSQAAALVHASNYNTWANWEADKRDERHRAIPLAAWELFLVKTNQRSIDRRELALVRGDSIQCRRCEAYITPPPEAACPACGLAEPAKRLAPAPREKRGGHHRRDARRPQ